MRRYRSWVPSLRQAGGRVLIISNGPARPQVLIQCVAENQPTRALDQLRLVGLATVPDDRVKQLEREGIVTESPIPVPSRRHIIDDTLIGWLDSPWDISPIREPIIVAGWICSTGEPITHLIVRIGTESQMIPLGVDRPDVAALHPSLPGVRHSGFHALLTISTRPTRSTPLV